MLAVILVLFLLLLYFAGYLDIIGATILGGAALLYVTGGNDVKPGFYTEDLLKRLLNVAVSKGEFVGLDKCDPIPESWEFLSAAGYCSGQYKCDNGSCPHLTLDGINIEADCIYEYNGEGHFHIVDYLAKGVDSLDELHNKLKSSQDRDDKKVDLLKRNNKKIIIIPYTVTSKYTYDYICSRLCELGLLKPIINYVFLPKIDEPHNTFVEQLNKLRQNVPISDILAESKQIIEANKKAANLYFEEHIKKPPSTC